MVLGKWLGKLTAGLAKTRSKLADGVRDLFRIGRKVDAQFLKELEETLILGDVGVAATRRIVDDLKTRCRQREITADDDLLGIIRRTSRTALPRGLGGSTSTRAAQLWSWRPASTAAARRRPSRGWPGSS